MQKSCIISLDLHFGANLVFVHPIFKKNFTSRNYFFLIFLGIPSFKELRSNYRIIIGVISFSY